LQDRSVGKGEEGDPAGAGDGDLNPALLAQAHIDEHVINLDDFFLRGLGRRGGGAEHHHEQRSQKIQWTTNRGPVNTTAANSPLTS
jgi:hypothetical protein